MKRLCGFDEGPASGTAVGGDDLASEEATCTGCEEQDGADDVSGGAEPAESGPPSDAATVFRRERGGQIGLQESRGDAVDPDAAGPKFPGKTYAKPLESSLRGCVDGKAGRAAFGDDRRDERDGGVTGGDAFVLDEHLPNTFADKHDRAPHVHRQHRVDLVVSCSRQHALVGDGRIGDAVVDAAEAGCGSFDEGLDRRRVARVELLNVELVGVSGSECRQSWRAGAGERGHAIPAGKQCLDDREPEATRAA